MDRLMIDYLPDVLKGYREYQGIADGQQWAFDRAWNHVDQALDDQFVDTATEKGIADWEGILKIVPKGSDTLEDRRFRVKTRLNEQLPFTLPSLRQQLENLCGKGEFSAEISPGTYLLAVRIALTAKSNYNDVQTMLTRVVPDNIVIDLDLKYNTHDVVHGFTHAELARYTYSEVRNEVLTHA